MGGGEKGGSEGPQVTKWRSRNFFVPLMVKGKILSPKLGGGGSLTECHTGGRGGGAVPLHTVSIRGMRLEGPPVFRRDPFRMAVCHANAPAMEASEGTSEN